MFLLTLGLLVWAIVSLLASLNVALGDVGRFLLIVAYVLIIVGGVETLIYLHNAGLMRL